MERRRKERPAEIWEHLACCSADVVCKGWLGLAAECHQVLMILFAGWPLVQLYKAERHIHWYYFVLHLSHGSLIPWIARCDVIPTAKAHDHEFLFYCSCSTPWIYRTTNEEAWRESYRRIMRVCQSFPNADLAKLRDVFLNIRNGEVEFNQVPLPTGNGRILSIPLQKLDKCRVCAVTTNLRLCNSCASVHPIVDIFHS